MCFAQYEAWQGKNPFPPSTKEHHLHDLKGGCLYLFLPIFLLLIVALTLYFASAVSDPVKLPSYQLPSVSFCTPEITFSSASPFNWTSLLFRNASSLPTRPPLLIQSVDLAILDHLSRPIPLSRLYPHWTFLHRTSSADSISPSISPSISSSIVAAFRPESMGRSLHYGASKGFPLLPSDQLWASGSWTDLFSQIHGVHQTAFVCFNLTFVVAPDDDAPLPEISFGIIDFSSSLLSDVSQPSLNSPSPNDLPIRIYSPSISSTISEHHLASFDHVCVPSHLKKSLNDVYCDEIGYLWRSSDLDILWIFPIMAFGSFNQTLLTADDIPLATAQASYDADDFLYDITTFMVQPLFLLSEHIYNIQGCSSNLDSIETSTWMIFYR